MSDHPAPSKAEREAAAWVAKLSQQSVSAKDIEGFFAWKRKSPKNDRAWRTLAAERRRYDRYAIRPDGEGYSVVDIWTAEPAVIAMTPQTGMSALDAEELAVMLNRQAAAGDRSIRQ